MSPTSIGGHAAVDFLNTSFAPNGEPVELIGDGKSFLAWAVAGSVLTSDEAARLSRKLGAKGVDAIAAEARKLREWSRSWLVRWRSAANRDYSNEIERLNEVLGKRLVQGKIVRDDEGLIIEYRSAIETADDVLGFLAAEIASLVTQEEAARLKSCGGEGCTLWFLDRTKAQRRIFCSAATCGNRAKVAAFRERQRE